MTKTLLGVYEHGVIRLLSKSKLPLFEHQKIEIKLEVAKATAQVTQAIIRIKPKIGKMLAESANFSPLGN